MAPVEAVARSRASTGRAQSTMLCGMGLDLAARRARAGRCTQIAAGLAGAHLLLWLLLSPSLRDAGVALMLAPAVAQAAAGVVAVVAGARLWRADRAALMRGPALAAVLVGSVVTIAAPLTWIGGGVRVSLRGLDAIDIPSFTSP
ncbi:hypothetical protein OV079_49645 [Nannocystis pusilla]|uniref:Uncharacterized protein n=1 Tax=Nannocystis pusilla TaxID=889268 RepID=A0A9X3F004_9BACT|nr:hypothetical protein [Nannocystis pusilla]MCY1013463.1 hypothetical protein [Nannocystis pusilla]